MSLSTKQCVPCRGGVPPLDSNQARQYLTEVPGWNLAEASRIQRRFEFKDFAGAAAFVDRVAELAEREGHHPDICFGWGYCDVTLYTHKIKGLHENDFIMAAKINEVYGHG
jgi:4a-hydroxytetrahydrobiopterin dehydratase